MLRMESDDRPRLNRCNNISFTKSIRAYVSLLRDNRNYRLYLLSHLCQHAGDATIKVATLLSLEHLVPGSGTAISAVIMCNVIPEIFVTPSGGIIADSYDRRKLMILLDGFGAVAGAVFIVAHRMMSVRALYTAVILRSILASLYHPVSTSITPMLVSDPEDLKKAIALSGIVWSLMFIFGGMFAGFVAATIGIEACFLFDSISYAISVVLMSKVQGTYNPLKQKTIESIFDIKTKDKINMTIPQRVRFFFRRCANPLWKFIVMTQAFVQYLVTCGFGMLIFMKASGELLSGADDIISVLATEVENDEVESGRRLGIIYSAQGVGCLLGPILANVFIVDGKKPQTQQFACVLAFAIGILGWAGIANSTTFELVCFFNFVRCLGTATIYLNSTLLLQSMAPREMLGRILSYDKVLASLSEAGIAFATGRLQDRGFGTHEIGLLCVCVGGFLLVFWSSFHLFGKGAAKKEFQEILDDNDWPYATKGEIDVLHSPTIV